MRILPREGSFCGDIPYALQLLLDRMIRRRNPLRLEEHVEEGADAVGHLKVELRAVCGGNASADLLSAHEGQWSNAIAGFRGGRGGGWGDDRW